LIVIPFILTSVTVVEELTNPYSLVEIEAEAMKSRSPHGRSNENKVGKVSRI
jgi:hypothetical protein